MTTNGRIYTHPDVLVRGVAEGWADPETDPTRIDWGERLRHAVIPFRIVDERPLNPFAPTGIRYGRNELGHWGEALAADALVTVTESSGARWILMIERDDGHGWALPGGHVEPGETPVHAAVRELAEETGLRLTDAVWRQRLPRYVPDPRVSDEAWMVTVLVSTDLSIYTRDPYTRDQFPDVTGADDDAQATWVRADTYETLADHLTTSYGGTVFAAHRGLLAQFLA